MKLLALFAALSAIQGPPAQPPADDYVILINATVVDGTGSPPRPDTSILVKGGSIVAVGGRELQRPDSARVIDLAGAFVVPGLIDGHVHLTPWRERDSKLEQLLRSGITAVREMGGDVRISGDAARRVKEGKLAGPDIYNAANFFGPRFLQDRRIQVAGSGYPPGNAPWMKMVTPDSDIPQAVAEAKKSGVAGLKLYSEIEPKLVGRIVSEAHRQGLKVWSHATIFPSKPSDAVAAGVDTIVHNGMIFPESQADLPVDYHTGTRQWMAKQDFHSVAPDAQPFRQLFEQMVRKGTIYEPTLAGSERFEAGDAVGTVLETIDWEAMRAWGCAATGEAYRAGVTISAGTDNNAGRVVIQREMELLVECGLTPLDAIVAATRNSAKSIGIDATHGTIEPGKAANMVVLDRNPIEQIAHIRSVRFVMKDGRIHQPADTVTVPDKGR